MDDDAYLQEAANDVDAPGLDGALRLTRPSVHVITVNYNCGHLLSRCVLGVLASENVTKVSVVDNNSTDGSIGILKRECNSEGRLEIIMNNENLGFAKANNQAVWRSKSRYLLLINPDCTVERDTIDGMCALMDAHSDVGMAGCLLLNPDGTEQAGGRRAVPTPWRSFIRAFGLFRLSKRWPKLCQDFYLHKQPLPDCPVAVEAISGAFMMVRRSALEEVGVMDEGYFMHCEDLDWCMRFRKSNWKILFVPNVNVVHIGGVSSRRRPFFVEWHKHKGMLRFYRKFFRHQYPGVLMWLVALGVWLRFIAVAVYHAKESVYRFGFRRD